jgi:hypothetical protein
LIPFALLGLAAVSGVITLVKVAGFFAASAKAQSIIGKVVAQDGSDTNLLDRNLAGSIEIADALKKRNLFAPPDPKRHPVSVVAGIMGDEAFINDQWHKVGDMIADAKVVAILPTQVRIEWEGRERTFTPISATSAAVQERAGRPNREPADRQKEDKPVKEKLNADSAKRDLLAGTTAEFSEKLMLKLLKQSQAFDEQKKHTDKQPDTVSKEQKQQYKMLKQSDAKPGNKKK